MNQKELLIISVTIFATILIWIVADLHHISKTVQLPKHDPKLSRPIQVTIDTKVFDTLESRQ